MRHSILLQLAANDWIGITAIVVPTLITGFSATFYMFRQFVQVLRRLDGLGADLNGLRAEVKVIGHTVNRMEPMVARIPLMEHKLDELWAIKPKLDELITLKPKLEDFITLKPKIEDFMTLRPKIEDFMTLRPKIEEIIEINFPLRTLVVLKPRIEELLQISGLGSTTNISHGNSPLTLNELGRKIFEDTGIGDYVDCRYDEILEAIRRTNPINPYQVQENLIQHMVSLARVPEHRPYLEDVSFKTGHPIDYILRVGALYVRDRVISDLLPDRKEDIDN